MLASWTFSAIRIFGEIVYNFQCAADRKLGGMGRQKSDGKKESSTTGYNVQRRLGEARGGVEERRGGGGAIGVVDEGGYAVQ